MRSPTRPPRCRARPSACRRSNFAPQGWTRRATFRAERHRVPRIPLLSGTRVAVVDVPEDGIVLRPPAPRVAIDDVGAAVREALRFPLSGPPLERLVTRGGTATVVIEVPTLPIPTSAPEPRHEAIAATVDE